VTILRILAVSDSIEGWLESPGVRDRLGPIDLLAGCGDLSAGYLEGLVTRFNVPSVGVPGNHDTDVFDVPGLIDLDGRMQKAAGLWLAGLGGSRRYKADGRHQYTEAEMTFRVSLLLPHLLLRRARYGRGADVILTHAPPHGVHDGTDLPHTGFVCFHLLLRAARPRLLLHGHTSYNRNLEAGESWIEGTRVLNVNPSRIIELEMNP
jgi:Icc-related predicted phosphoesterase